MGSISAAAIARHVAQAEGEREKVKEKERDSPKSENMKEQKDLEIGVVSNAEKKKKKKDSLTLTPSLSNLDPAVVTDVIIESGFATTEFLSFLSRIYAAEERNGKPISSYGREKFLSKWKTESNLTESYSSFASFHRRDRRHVMTFLHAEDDRVVKVANMDENVRECEKGMKVKEGESERESKGDKRCQVFRSVYGQHYVWMRKDKVEAFLDDVL